MIERIKNLKTFIGSNSAWWLFLRIGLWIGAISILLRLISLPRLLRILNPAAPAAKKWPRDQLVNFASFWLGREAAFFSKSCLKRSLVLFRYFRLQSEPARFFIGVRNQDAKLMGHAWIKFGEEKLFPDEDLNYRIIYTFPAENAKPAHNSASN